MIKPRFTISDWSCFLFLWEHCPLVSSFCDYGGVAPGPHSHCWRVCSCHWRCWRGEWPCWNGFGFLRWGCFRGRGGGGSCPGACQKTTHCFRAQMCIWAFCRVQICICIYINTSGSVFQKKNKQMQMRLWILEQI